MKLAVLSGGSKGLGAALAAGYVRDGFEVVEFSRSAPHPFSVRVDLADPERAAGEIAETLSRFSCRSYREIVIVNNSGTVEPVGPAARKEVARILQNLNTNFVGAILFISEAIRQFQDHACKKTIAQVSSGAALRGIAGWSLYCGAKAGMENFMQSVSLEQQVEAHPFHAISIDPGVMDTDMQARIRESNDADFPGIERFIDLKRSGSLRPPALVADAVRRIVTQNGRGGSRYSVTDFLD